MDDEKKWMLITYYCPTHGDSGFVKPIEITKKEISRTFSKKDRSCKNWLLRTFFKFEENFKNLKVKILLECNDIAS